MGRDATFRRQQVINCTQFSSKIHPEIMTDQKQSGTKKPLLTHYRQQLMAHVVSSYAGNKGNTAALLDRNAFLGNCETERMRLC